MSGENRMVLRFRLHLLMAEKRMSNKELARKTGMHVMTISRLRNTDYDPALSIGAIEALCRALECQPGDLLIYEDAPEIS